MKDFWRFLRFFGAFCLTLFIVSCGSNTQQEGNRRIEWGHVGIGGGGAMFNPAVSPHNPDFAFVTSDMGGSFVTSNGGESWRMFNLGSQVRFFVFDPVDPNVVYAQSFGLFKSADQGLTWQLLYPHPSDVVCKVSRGDHAGEVLVLKDSTQRSVQALAIDPTQSRIVYAAIRIDRNLALYRSSDGGVEWTKERELEQDVKNIFIDPSSPVDQRTLYVAWRNGVHQRVNGQWQSFDTPNKDVKFNFFSGGYDAGLKKFILYGISGRGYFNRVDDTQSGIFFSDDGGKTWVNRQEGVLNYAMRGKEKAEFRAMATSAYNPATIYVSYNGLVIHPDTTCIGVAKSDDFGRTWTLPWKDKITKDHTGDVTSPNYGGDWMDIRYGPEWGENPFNIAVSPSNPHVCYTTDFGRTIKTANGGKTWEAVYTKKLPDGSWTTRGLEVSCMYDLFFDPFDENHIFIALTDVGLQESKNGGKGWFSGTYKNGVPKAWVNSTYWIAFDPEVKGRVWAAMSGNHDLPRPKMWRSAAGVSNFVGGVLRSDDGGAHWEVVSTSIGEGAATHVLLDPKSPKDRRTLYASIFGKGVYKSTDGGLTWTQKNRGIEGAEPLAWRIERRESDGALFLVVNRRSENGSIGNDQDGALYKSTDGAETWTKMTLPEGCNGPTSIVTTKKYPKRLVLSAWGRVVREDRFASDIRGGIFSSDDEGKNWTQVMGDVCNGKMPLILCGDKGVGNGKMPLILCGDKGVGNGWKPLVLCGDKGVCNGWKPLMLCGDKGVGNGWKPLMLCGDTKAGYYPDQHIHDISFDPRNGRYYACGFNASAYYSEDGAKTWTRIRGYNFKWGRKVVPDPRDQQMIFVTTFGGGVWYGPANGDPEATEDLLTPFVRR